MSYRPIIRSAYEDFGSATTIDDYAPLAERIILRGRVVMLRGIQKPGPGSPRRLWIYGDKAGGYAVQLLAQDPNSLEGNRIENFGITAYWNAFVLEYIDNFMTSGTDRGRWVTENYAT